MSEERSPLSPHALTAAEVRSLEVGTHIVIYNTKMGVTGTLAYQRIEEDRIYGHVVNSDGTADPMVETSRYLKDCGLEPYRNGNWNGLNYTILASDLDKVKKPTSPGRFDGPWEML